MRFLGTWAVMSLALPLCAQPPQAPLILRSTTRLVQLNVIVQDKKGNPVTDLKKEDFEVKDAGKVQTVSLFSMESNAPLEGSERLAVTPQAQRPSHQRQKKRRAPEHAPRCGIQRVISLKWFPHPRAALAAGRSPQARSSIG